MNLGICKHELQIGRSEQVNHMKIDDFTFGQKVAMFFKKYVKICLTICILKSFYVFECF